MKLYSWVFARASEASTLFIEPHFKGSEPYAHLIKQEKVLHWFEYDGKQSHLWKVTKYTENEKELTLFLEGGAKVVLFQKRTRRVSQFPIST